MGKKQYIFSKPEIEQVAATVMQIESLTAHFRAPGPHR
jgi:hypothetical protein